jgi:hypothetical protein
MTTRSKSPITKEKLLDLFQTESTIIIDEPIKTIVKTIAKSIQPPSDSTLYMFSPNTIKLLESFTPGTRKYMAHDLEIDDTKIYNAEQKSEEKDELYEFFENTAVGIFLEKWVCCYLRCNCGDRFVKYENPNMPVVDIKCRDQNKSHSIEHHGPQYYQIKSSELYKTYRGYEYFQLEPYQYIHTGSIRFGKICHEIKINDPDKSLLIGYICIKYKYNTDSNINIDKLQSFILQPKYKFDKPIDTNLQYYVYGDTDIKKPIILFNPVLFNIYRFQQIQVQLENIQISQFIENKNLYIVPFNLSY